MFSLFLFFTLSCLGISSVLGSIIRRLPHGQQLLSSLVALALCFWLSMNVIGSESILRSTETGTLPEAEQIIDFLKLRLKPGDKIAAAPPSDYPLKYYALEKGLSLDFLEPNIGQARRLVVVFNKSFDSDLNQIIKDSNYPNQIIVDKSPILLKDFSTANLLFLNNSKGPEDANN